MVEIGGGVIGRTKAGKFYWEKKRILFIWPTFLGNGFVGGYVNQKS